MIIHNLEQGTPEWFAVRLGKLTASDAQAIATAGKGLDTLVIEKVAELMTGKQKPQIQNANLDRGHLLEPMARDSYEIETGVPVVEVGFCELDEFIGASPDGMVGEDGLAEIKCKDDSNFVRYLLDKKIDTAHEWQMQMQMWVTGREWVDYIVFNDNFPNPIVIQRVMRNEVSIAKLQAGCSLASGQIKSILERIKC